MTPPLPAALGALESGTDAVLVTVLDARGSAPREAGTAMLVTQGGVSGTIGGGNLEHQAIAQARKLLTGDSRFAVQDYALGPLLAQCCGGHVTLALERLGPADRDWLAAHGDGRAGGVALDLATGKRSLTTDTPVAPLLLDDTGAPLTPPARARTASRFLMPLSAGRTPLFIFGAGHVGRAVAKLVADLPFATRWADSRADEFPNPPPPGLRPVVTDAPETLVETAPEGAFYLVFTHSHTLDYTLTRAILARGDSGYCGLIGSATKRARFVKRLVDEDGLDATALDRLTCPIGLQAVPGKAPEAIAVGVAGELLAVRGAAPASTA
ncbi:xanthine dehydrogenase accessory protein XdhC [Yunchengibacter salinarum]|uniref:xanthine dehydrogenase accessory protein XdhC n=1 Tax=Yunchengibacter salinarum TaxID=3133399 RepID=UPI0035B58462